MHTSSHKHRPELHITAETGVLEAPAGAFFAEGSMHVFHQFRPLPDEGSRWAHQVASEVAYDWDVCDDVLAPLGAAGHPGDTSGHAPAETELDVLAGSTIITEAGYELFFVTSRPQESQAGGATEGAEDGVEALETNIPHGTRGPRQFTIQRAVMDEITTTEVSDDPKVTDPRVKRLGPIDIDDSAHPVANLVTPCAIRHEDPTQPGTPWLMLALNLIGEHDAEILVLRSADRHHWRVLGPLSLPDAANVRPGRPFAPRIITMKDSGSGVERDVVFITYPGGAGESNEIAGYLVGNLQGAAFDVLSPYTPIDYGHDFTRPRLIPHTSPVMFGLVGAHPSLEGQWANCLSAPRYLSLVDGVLFQDIIGAPEAVQRFSDYAFIWSGQLDAAQGQVDIEVRDNSGQLVVAVSYREDAVTVTRLGVDSRTAPLTDADSDTLTIFVDGPVLEVFADGGATTLTSAIPAHSKIATVDVSTQGGAKILTSMQTHGQQLQRMHAGLHSPEDQEEFMAQAAAADRELAEGLFSDEEL